MPLILRTNKDEPLTHAELDGNLTFLDQRITSLSNSEANKVITWTEIQSKPVLFDGDYNSLQNIPVLFDGDYNNLTNTPVVFDGNYQNLTNKPFIPTALNDLSNVTSPTPSIDQVLTWTGSTWAPQDTFDKDYNSLTNRPTIPSELSDLSNVSPVAPSEGEVLKWDGSEWAPAAGASGGAETDPIVGAINGIVKADGAGNISAAVAGTDYSTFDGDYNSLTNKPTIPTAYTDSDVDAHLNQSNPTSGHVLSWDGADYAWVANAGGIALTDLSVTTAANGIASLSYDNINGVFTYTPPDLSSFSTFDGDYNSLTNKPTIPTAYTDSDVDAHLNQSNPTSGYVLSWNGSDYAWVAQSSGGGGTDTVIAPFAFASVNTTANGSGVGMSWSNWDAVNGTMDFTFDNDNAQPDTNYIVVTDGEANDDGRLVSIQNKTVNGFEASFYDTNGIRTPSTADAYALIVYGSTPTATITGSNVSNASIGALSDVSISSATTGQVLKYNGSSWVNDTDAGGSVTNMASLTDVDSVDTVASGDFLLFDGSSSEYKFVAFEAEVNGLIDNRTGSSGHISTQSQYAGIITTDPADPTDTAHHVLSNTGTPSVQGASTAWYYGDVVSDPANPTTSVVLDIDSAILTADVVGNITSAGTSTFSGTVDFSNTSNVDFTGATVSGLSITSTDTLQDVTTRGATTTDLIDFQAGMTVGGADLHILNHGILEQLVQVNNPTGIVTYDCNATNVWWNIQPAADWTANFININVPLDSARNVTLAIIQESQPFIPSAVQIMGAPQTIRWQGGTPPTGTANGVDVVSFSIIVIGATYHILGQLVDFS